MSNERLHENWRQLNDLWHKAEEERDAALAEVEMLKGQVEELRQLEYGYPRRRCANMTCKVGSFFPTRSNKQFCSDQCRSTHNARSFRKRRRALKATEPKSEKED